MPGRQFSAAWKTISISNHHHCLNSPKLPLQTENNSTEETSTFSNWQWNVCVRRKFCVSLRNRHTSERASLFNHLSSSFSFFFIIYINNRNRQTKQREKNENYSWFQLVNCSLLSFYVVSSYPLLLPLTTLLDICKWDEKTLLVRERERKKKWTRNFQLPAPLSFRIEFRI